MSTGYNTTRYPTNSTVATAYLQVLTGGYSHQGGTVTRTIQVPRLGSARIENTSAQSEFLMGSGFRYRLDPRTAIEVQHISTQMGTTFIKQRGPEALPNSQVFAEGVPSPTGTEADMLNMDWSQYQG